LAMQLPVPVPEGVKTPPCVMVPPVAVHVTPVLYAPVPATVATQVEVCDEVMLDGFATTLMLVTVGEAFVMEIAAAPDTFVNPACVDVALQLPEPAPEGVNTPPCVMVPPVAVQVTPVLYAPVPATAATQVAVCVVLIDDGVAATPIPVIVTAIVAGATPMDAELDLELS